MPDASNQPKRLDFTSQQTPRLAYHTRWWRLAMLFLSGTSLFLLLALLHVFSSL
jgi:hypothetical protein